jgi:predicted small metal-binding protein
MAKLINCECGRTFRGETSDEVVEQAQEHIRQSHPELVETVSPEQLADWIEDE